MSVELVAIPFDKLVAMQNVWFPFVARVAKRQRCFVEQRLAEIYSGNVGIFLAWDRERKIVTAACGYSFIVRGPARIGRLVWFSGKMADAFALYGDAEQFFRAQGCVGMSTIARFGFGTDFKRLGYHLTHCEYEKDFNG